MRWRDGLWEFMSNQEVRVSWASGWGGMEVIGEVCRVHSGVCMRARSCGPTFAPSQVLDMISGLDDPRQAVEVLIAEANARWMKEEQVIDDTTVIVAYLDVPPTPAGM